MAIIVPNVAELTLLDDLRTNRLNNASVRIGLFKNNITVDASTVYADFTAADFTGYSALGTLTFGAAFTNGSGKAETDSAVMTFNYTDVAGSQTVYGWYLYDTTGSKLLFAENFSSPIVLTPTLNQLDIQVKFTGSSEA